LPEEFVSYFSSELVDEIIAKCLKLVEKNPNDPHHYKNLGHAFFKKGNYPQAVTAFEKAASINPRDTSLFLAIGRCYELQKDFEKAETAFQTALSQKPEWPDTHYWVGKIHFEKGNLEEAKKCALEAINRNPKFRDGLYLLAMIHEKTGNFPEAIVTLKKIIALPFHPEKSKNPFPYDLEILFDDPVLLDETIRQIEKALKSNDNYADLHFKLGMAYRRKGLKEKAMAEFKRAIQLNPNFHLARHYYWNWESNKPE